MTEAFKAGLSIGLTIGVIIGAGFVFLLLILFPLPH